MFGIYLILWTNKKRVVLSCFWTLAHAILFGLSTVPAPPHPFPPCVCPSGFSMDQGFSASALLTSWVSYLVVVGAEPCTSGCGAAPLASFHWMPVAPSPRPLLHQLYSQNRLQTRLFAERDVAFPGKLSFASSTRLTLLAPGLQGPCMCSCLHHVPQHRATPFLLTARAQQAPHSQRVLYKCM